jgi:signal transduction histidine kinase
LQQAEAASRVSDLERGLQDLQILEQQRAEVCREAAHDLRGTVGVITTASAVIASDNVPDPARARFAQLLRRNVASLRELLVDLMDLARLEAGQEQRKIAPFDAAQLLRDFCESVRYAASEHNLSLEAEGVESLPVEGDAIKVQRIVQNLALNAIKVTARGGVRITWQPHEVSDVPQWMVCVQDTGPGLDSVHAAPLASVLKQATIAAQDIDVRAMLAGEAVDRAEPAATLASQSTISYGGGEGIGLSIVKRLCELLDASLELQSVPGTGTTFRVIFPQRYGGSVGLQK